jgi:hypothetical protein
MSVRSIVVTIAVLLSTFLSTFIFADKLSLASNKAKRSDELPLHEQALQQIRDQQGVITKPLPHLFPTAYTFNPEAVIPPQCYTKTAGKFNPCYVCHQNEVKGRENKMNDGDLQLEYSFSEVGETNHWHNLFEDRSEQVAAISDEEIDQWIQQDNYSDLAPRLKAAGFKGWIPDLKNLQHGAAAFDKYGFAKDGSHWVAFNYKPFPSTFWPTNGATDDVMIRLHKRFRTTSEGEYSQDIYMANLAITEAKVKGFDSITTIPVDENIIGVDLNGDGKLSLVDEISKLDSYVGAAEDIFIDTYLYPLGTEFLHTVRYVGIDKQNQITTSTRMKEVRYMKKWVDSSKATYARGYFLESLAKERGELPQFKLLGDHGLDNEFAWSVQGFIEGHDGQLRTLSYEENLACMGCHASIGATIDKTFSLPRKVDGAAGWGYINLKGMSDAPNLGETKGEIATYFERVGGGGEFRSNPEMFSRWFNQDGTVNDAAVDQAVDVYELITPSQQRARELNKAYRVLVAEQNFIYGRDATVVPPFNVYAKIDNKTAPTLPDSLHYDWDIRLDWQKQKAK